jgi:predicted metalloprotease with PDZ domain
MPFNDDELFPAIVELTYPEIKTFFDTYVSGKTPIPYNEFFAKVGVQEKEVEEVTGTFLKGQEPYIDGNPQSKELFFREGIAYNSFLKELGVQPKDVIKSINGTDYNTDNVYALIMTARSWKVGDEVSLVIERDGKEMTLNADFAIPMGSKTSLNEMELDENDARVKLRKAWLGN